MNEMIILASEQIISGDRHIDTGIGAGGIIGGLLGLWWLLGFLFPDKPKK